MIQYAEMLKTIISKGYTIPAARENMPTTKMYNSIQSRYNFKKGFPILTGKTMPFYSIVAELVGFMKGITDVREFDKLGTKVWWDNAYKWNVKDKEQVWPSFKDRTLQEYKDEKIIRAGFNLGRIYSAQWRNWFGMSNSKSGYINQRVDQLANIIASINNNPYSRYHAMTTWNPAEMNKLTVSQPNCHVYFQASCAPISVSKDHIKRMLKMFLDDYTVNSLIDNGYDPKNVLMTHLTQRSCDMFLGVPFNITSYSLFTVLLGIFTNTLPWEFVWDGVNSHIYDNHMPQVWDYLDREIHELPKLHIENIYSLADIELLETLDDIKQCFKLINYNSSGKIKADLSVGL